jgi:transcriptional regulator with XRE-family HTH domain
MSESNDLGRYLEKSRYSKCFSLREAAKITGLSHAYIRDIELGINRSTNREMTPSPLTLRALADCYGINHLILYQMAGFIDENELSTMKKGVEAFEREGMFLQKKKFWK